MNEKEINDYREAIEKIIEENRQSAKDNALRFVLETDQIAFKEAITCTTAADSYEAALQLFNKSIDNDG